MTDYNFQGDITQFDPNTILYEGENALFLTDCAKLTYEPKESIKKIMTKLGFKNFQFFSGKSTQAFIAGNDKFIVVAFRGTEGKVSDIITDAKVKLRKGPIGKVHRGFRGGLREVWGDKVEDKSKDMRLIVKKFQNKKQSIWFCGHSLGAALATLAAADYVVNGNTADVSAVKGIYTIGQPRVGNDEFAEGFDDYLGKQCFRFVNNNDIVTRIPLPGLVFKYTHVGQQLYINSNCRLIGTIPWWRRAIDGIRGVRKDIGHIGLDALNDHGSEDYVNLVNNNRSVKVTVT